MFQAATYCRPCSTLYSGSGNADHGIRQGVNLRMVTSIFERRVRTCDGQRESCSRFSICFVLMTAMGLLEAITLAFSMATAGIGQI